MRRISLALVMALVLVAPAFADEVCPFAVTPAAERDSLYRMLAANARSVALAPSASPASSKRRSAGKPIFTPRELPVANFIDTHIAAKQKKDGVYPAAIAGDEEFLRRVYLDLTGTIPTSAEVLAFVADGSADKRTKKIDQLLASDAFTDRWTMWFGDLVQNVQVANNSLEYYLGRNAYHAFIRDSVRSGKPYDQMVRELVAGSGLNFSSGPANWIVRQLQNNGPAQDSYDNMASHSAEKFLAIPMLCISCHDGAGHLETVNFWLRGKTRYQFWEMAAFFAMTLARGTQYTDPANPNATLFQFSVGLNANGAYRLATTGGNKSPRQPTNGQETVTPAFITTGEKPKPGEEPRVAYGRMLTAERQFARAAVNYLWKEMFGLGIVEPTNAFDLSKLATQPTHPELLEALTDEFISKNYSIRAVLRAMATSNAYQLSTAYTESTWNDAWVPYYARHYPRRMMAEVVFDAIATATNMPQSFNVQGTSPVSVAMQMPDPLEGRNAQPTQFINNFGRGDRDDTARSNDSSIIQALSMLNNQTLVSRVRRTGNNSTMSKVLAASTDPGTITEQLYLATLSRKPTAEERQIAVDYLKAGTLAERAEDLQYVLLNSLEFIFQ
ncbi:MAG TPA: DUF1549 domain-containing protein [Thermoanaerobaculia bacterium]|nr:DUF1549 domain-containing protein [Thermoanaerobaculia bacterium]